MYICVYIYIYIYIYKDVSLASPSSVYLLSHAVCDFTFQFKAFSVSIGTISVDLFSEAKFQTKRHHFLVSLDSNKTYQTQDIHPPSSSRFTTFCFKGFGSYGDILYFTTRCGLFREQIWVIIEFRSEGNQYFLCSFRRVPVFPLGKIEKVDHGVIV